MKNKFKISKKGFSLVEAIVATLLLSIVVVTLISSVTLTRRAILQNSVKDVAATKAQATVELLIQALSQPIPPDIPGLEALTGATNSEGKSFDISKGDLQFYYEADSVNGGYKIYACAFYREGKEKVILQGYASVASEDFKPKEVTKP